MEGNSKEEKEGVLIELKKMHEKLSVAIKSTGLDCSIGFKSVQNVSMDKEGEGYVALFTVVVDLGKVPLSASIAQ